MFFFQQIKNIHTSIENPSEKEQQRSQLTRMKRAIGTKCSDTVLTMSEDQQGYYNFTVSKEYSSI